MKNRYFAALALAGLVSFAACAAEEEAEIVEEPALEEPIAAPAPIEPAPVVTDTLMGLDTAAADTAL